MKFLIRILITALGIFLGSKFLTGVQSRNYGYSILVALVVAVLSVTVGFLLKILTLGILALGIFSLLLDAILFQIADWFLKDFDIKNFWWALALAAIVAITEMILVGLVL